MLILDPLEQILKNVEDKKFESPVGRHGTDEQVPSVKVTLPCVLAPPLNSFVIVIR